MGIEDMYNPTDIHSASACAKTASKAYRYLSRPAQALQKSISTIT
jgi:hypothetical protein